jgi:hypothetical protein
LTLLCRSIIKSGNIIYEEEDKEKITKFASIFKIMTDSFPVFIDSLRYIVHTPYTYDFEDVAGDKDWSQMFVTKLLHTRKGNCHSLPFLYKILAEELGEEAHLAIAPNHIYIKHQSLKNGWFNTELTSGIFPIDAWLMASGYIHLDAVKNKIYMAPVSEQESIAICLIDLAKGYEKKEKNPDLDFIIQCCETTLKYYPNYINAHLLKAETEKKKFEKIQKQYNAKSPSEIFHIPEAEKIFKEMTQGYTHIHKSGYRRMPEKMYLQWLVSLQEEKAKYLNKTISNFKN